MLSPDLLRVIKNISFIVLFSFFSINLKSSLVRDKNLSDESTTVPSLITVIGIPLSVMFNFICSGVRGARFGFWRTLRLPFTSKNAVSISSSSKIPCIRSISTKSKMVILTLRMAFWSITPFFITATALPLKIRLSLRFFKIITDAIISKNTSINIATRPMLIGCETS